MKLFVDTNVLIDVLAMRKPFYAASANVVSLVEKGMVKGFISSISFNNIYYVLRKAADKRTADKALRFLRDLFEPVAPDALILSQAIDSDIDDFEDAIQFHSAIRIDANCIVTRNPAHFSGMGAKPAIATPDEFLSVWTIKQSI